MNRPRHFSLEREVLAVRTLILFVTLHLFSVSSTRADERHLLFPAYPKEAFDHHDEGVVVVKVTFGSQGKVSECHVVHSNASKLLQDSTVSFIQKNWIAVQLAGKTETVPIDYELHPSVPTPYPSTFPQPPYPYHALLTREEGAVTVRVTFGPDGRVISCTVVDSTAARDLQDSTVANIKENWRGSEFAGKTFQFPITYKLRDN
jgi:TonB family protein